MLDSVLGLAALGRAPRVVGLSAHPDDLEIGCGGTLLALAQQHPGLELLSVVLTGRPERVAEAQSAVDGFTSGRGRSVALGLPDGFLPAHWEAAKTQLAAVLADLRPDLVLAPSADDAHQDHRVVSEFAWQLCRGALVLEYEIPKWEGDLVRRNAYVALDDEQVERKLTLLAAHFPSQADKPWFDDDVFRGLLRLRGVECGARWAEAFTAKKLLLRP